MWWNVGNFNEGCSLFYAKNYYFDFKNMGKVDNNGLGLVKIQIFILEN
jgi:hypothetical protein